jgi:ribokinase
LLKGAGDAFIGSLSHYFGKGGDLHKAVELATEYASLSVERKGAQTSYLYLDELSEKLRH